jgi:hypothetical protein
MKLPRVQFTVRRMMVIVAIVGLGAGVICWKVRGPTVFVEPAPLPRWANPDHEIYDIVLSDLIDNPEFNLTIGQGGPKKTQILLNRCSLSPITRKYLSFDRWFHENKVSQEVLDDLVDRNPRDVRYELVDYQPGSPGISLAVLNESELDGDYALRFPGACGYVVPHLPGYSKDGKTALFHFSIQPLGYHPGWGCYLLEKLEGRWKIARKNIYHLL